jgi:hypothetical protein
MCPLFHEEHAAEIGAEKFFKSELEYDFIQIPNAK